MKRVTGIGGVFFKCKDPEALKDWYTKHLGVKSGQYGGVFLWRKNDEPTHRAYTSWSPFPNETDYFQPSQKEVMINYRVEDLEKLLPILKEEGVEVVGEIQTYDYGKFAHIVDLEGNKIELWEPIDKVFDGFYKEEDCNF